MPIVYNQGSNKNEWFIIISLILGAALVLICKKRFSKKELFIYLLLGALSGMYFDKTISLEPFELYDVNDSSSYEFMDFLSYVSYGPYSYFYIYLYDHFKIKKSYTPVYILFWALISFVIEAFAESLGVYHYKNGYTIYYSFPIYIAVLSLQIYLYKVINSAN